MKTLGELGRFLFGERLSMSVVILRGEYVVSLHERGAPRSIHGRAVSFPEAVDRAVGALARARSRGAEARS